MNSAGCDVNTLPAHREPLFENFSMDRRASMPLDLRRKLQRMKYANTRARQAERQERTELAVFEE